VHSFSAAPISPTNVLIREEFIFLNPTTCDRTSNISMRPPSEPPQPALTPAAYVRKIDEWNFPPPPATRRLRSDYRAAVFPDS